MSVAIAPIAPVLATSRTASVEPHADPNRPVVDVLDKLDQKRDHSGGLTEAELKTLESEEPFVPLDLAEIRVKSMMDDLNTMKEDHLGRMETMQKVYNALVRNNHKIANEQLEKAKKLAMERINFYKDKAVEINKQLRDEKKKFEKDLRQRDKEAEKEKKNRAKENQANADKLATLLTLKKELDAEKEQLQQTILIKDAEMEGLQEKMRALEKSSEAADAFEAEKTALVKSHEDELKGLKDDIAKKESTIRALEEAVAEGGGLGLGAGIGRGPTSSIVSKEELDNLQQKLSDAQMKIPRLERDKLALQQEVDGLRSQVLNSAMDAEAIVAAKAKVDALQDKIKEVDAERVAEAEKHRQAVERLMEAQGIEQAAALAAQQAMYDKMIKQMIKAGQKAAKEKENQAAASVTATAVSEAKRQMDEAEAQRVNVMNAKKDEDMKRRRGLTRLGEVEEELKLKREDLSETDPKLQDLTQEIKALEEAVAAAMADRDRVSKYTEEQARAQFAQLNLAWDEASPQMVTQMLTASSAYAVCMENYNRMKELKEEGDQLKELVKSDDTNVSGPARLRQRELKAQFDKHKEQVTEAKATCHTTLMALGLFKRGDPEPTDAFIDSVTLAAEMWREVQLKAPPPKKEPSAELLAELAKFGLTPTRMTPEVVNDLEMLAATGDESLQAIRESKQISGEASELGARRDALGAELEKAKEELALAKGENASEEDIAAKDENVNKLAAQLVECATAFDALQNRINSLKAAFQNSKKAYTALVQKHALDSNGVTFNNSSHFKNAGKLALAWKAYEAEAVPEPVKATKPEEIPDGPTEEQVEQQRQLQEKVTGLNTRIKELEADLAALQEEDESYRKQKQFLDMQEIAAERALKEAKTKLTKAKQAAGEEGGEDKSNEAEEEEEEDITGGVTITLSMDVAEANRQLAALASEIASLKAALAQTERARDQLKEQIDGERKRHKTEVARMEAMIHEAQQDYQLMEQKWRTTAGTYYAKPDGSQTQIAHEVQAQVGASGSTDEAVEKLKVMLHEAGQRREDAELKERNAQIRIRELEAQLSAAMNGQPIPETRVVVEVPVGAGSADVSAGSAAAAAGGGGVSSAELEAAKQAAQEHKEARVKAENELASVRAQLQVLQESSKGSGAEMQQKLMATTQALEEAKAATRDKETERAEEESAKVAAQARVSALEQELAGVRERLESERDAATSRAETLEQQLAETSATLSARVADVERLEGEVAAVQASMVAFQAEVEQRVAAMRAEKEAELASQKQEFDTALSNVNATLEQTRGELGVEVSAKEAALSESAERKSRIEALEDEGKRNLIKFNDVLHKYTEEQERRKYFQQEYEAVKGKIRVYARIRPFIRLERESKDPLALQKCVTPGPNVWTLKLSSTRQNVTGQSETVVQEKTFDHVFLSGYEEEYPGADNGSQAQVFKECEGFAEMAFDGLNTCIFAYGQSGSGKTWTMRGSTTDKEQWGLKPRMIEHVYKLRDATKNRFVTKIWCTMFEIYNDQLQDIFERWEQVSKWEAKEKKCFKCFTQGHSYKECTNCAKCRQSGHNFSACRSKQIGQLYIDRFKPPEKSLNVKILGNQRVYIENLVEKPFDTAEEMLQFCDEAEMLRRVRATGLNDESSRSHLIFAINIKKTDLKPKDPTKKEFQGKLSLCDLAGSEKAERTLMGDNVTPEDKNLMLAEGKAINTSLSALTKVFNTLGQKLKPGEKRMVATFRDNALTNVMQDSIGGNARTLMFVNTSPSAMNYEETNTTLKYGDLVQNITGQVATTDLAMDEYIAKIADLEARLRKYEGGEGAA